MGHAITIGEVYDALLCHCGNDVMVFESDDSEEWFSSMEIRLVILFGIF